MPRLRRCQQCHQPTMKLYESKPIRLGIVEESYLCDCGWSMKTMNTPGLVIWWGMSLVLAVMFTVALVSGKVQRGDELPVALFAIALVGLVAGLGARATLAYVRNPPVEG